LKKEKEIKRLIVEMDLELWKRLKIQATRENKTIKEAVEILVKAYLKNSKTLVNILTD